jgi:glucose/arabinose dehydrogenase
LLRLDLGSGSVTEIGGVPDAFTQLDAGILDVVPHPDFVDNQWLYFSYARGDVDSSQTVVARARLVGDELVDLQELLAAVPPLPGASHFGSRLVLRDGYLFIAQGERDHRDHAQDLGSHNGKILRIHDDGRVPVDNPFVDVEGALPEIWSYGHRNPQGLAFDPATGILWSHEHGPMGGDEINRIEPGADYGWPRVSFGNEYAGEPVGDGRAYGDGVTDPTWVYVPSIAPSGMNHYDGDAFPAWRGSFLIGALALRHLNRIRVEGDQVTLEERLLQDQGWRIRFAIEGPDGAVYVGADEVGVVRLRPLQATAN